MRVNFFPIYNTHKKDLWRSCLSLTCISFKKNTNLLQTPITESFLFSWIERIAEEPIFGSFAEQGNISCKVITSTICLALKFNSCQINAFPVGHHFGPFLDTGQWIGEIFLGYCVDSEMDVSVGATAGCDGNAAVSTMRVYVTMSHKTTGIWFYHSRLIFYNWTHYSPNSPGLVLDNPHVSPAKLPKECIICANIFSCRTFIILMRTSTYEIGDGHDDLPLPI